MENSPLFRSGHTACAGCGQAIAARLVIEAAGANTIVVNNTGCLEVFSTKYPDTAWGVPWIHSLFENSAAVASGVEAALIYLGKKNSTNVIAQGGDGSTGDIGLQALSGMLERGHDVLYVCLPPETELILGDGSIVEIGEFVDNLIAQNELKTQKLLLYCDKVVQERLSCFHGTPILNNLIIPLKQDEQDNLKRVEITPATGRVLSWDKSQFLPMNVICAQRKESGRSLIKITTASGQKLSLTGEHKVLIDALEGPRWQRADLLKPKDELFAPRKIWLDTEKEFYLVDFLDGNIKVKISLSTKEKINQVLIKNYGSIKEAAKVIGFKYWQMKERNRLVDLGVLKKICKASAVLKWVEIREELFFFGTQGGKIMEIKEKKFTQELMYLLGLISSDGSLDNKTHAVIFINKNDSLLKEFEETYSKLFYGRKISRFINKDGITYLTVSDPILHTLAKRLHIKTDPKELIKLSERLIAGFIRGFFDGDGYCGITKNKLSFDARVILSTVEEKLAKRLRLMLQRLGIACFGVGRMDRFDLIISSKEDIKKFFNLVSSRHPKQMDAMKKIEKLWQGRETRGKYFSIAPKICGKILAHICKQEDIPITRLDKKRNICSLAAGTRRATKERFKRYREDLIKIIPQDRKDLFKELDLYLEDDFYLDPVEKIEIVPSKSRFVYDITVDNTHLFVPEGAFVISNCYDNEAYMNCLSLDSLVMTKDGYKKITEIKTGDGIYAFDQNTHQLVIKECSGVFDNGLKEVFELKTLHHSIKATANHPFLILKRNGRGKENTFVWKTLEEIKIGDKVVTLKGMNGDCRPFKFQEIKKAKKGDYKVNKVNAINLPRESDPDIMKYLGIFVGDGWRRKDRGEIGFALPAGKKARSILTGLHEKIFGSKITSNQEYVYANSVNLASFIDTLELGQGAKHKTIPAWVFMLPQEQKEAFVEGLMLADGYVCGRSKRYVSANLDLLKRLRLLLQTLDYRVGKIHAQVKKKGTICVRRALLKDSEYGYICFSKREKWNTEKYPSQYRYQDFLIDNKFFRTQEVTSVESKGIEPTLDLRVEGEHNFIADGIVVHNTGVQRSGLTPFDTNTTTSPSGAQSSGNIRPKKPIPEICLAHGIPYVACASVGFPQDLSRKVKKAISIKGPKYIQIHASCPLGWRHEANQMLPVAKLAVETGLYPLFEYENGVLTGRKQIIPKPVEEYLKTQGRFKHLLNNPEEIKKIQAIADNNIKKYNLKLEV